MLYTKSNIIKSLANCSLHSWYQGSSPKSKLLSHCTFQLLFSLFISRNVFKSLGQETFSSYQIFYIFLLRRWQIELNIYPTLFSPLCPIFLKSCSSDILITWIPLKFQWTGLQVAHAWLLLALMQLCVSGITIVGVRKIKHELHFVIHGYFLFYNQTCNYSILVIVLRLVRSTSSLL